MSPGSANNAFHNLELRIVAISAPLSEARTCVILALCTPAPPLSRTRITKRAEPNDSVNAPILTQTWSTQVDFVETRDMNTDLASIAAGKGEAKGFEALRGKHGADLVQMIGFYEGSCGTG